LPRGLIALFRKRPTNITNDKKIIRYKNAGCKRPRPPFKFNANEVEKNLLLYWIALSWIGFSIFCCIYEHLSCFGIRHGSPRETRFSPRKLCVAPKLLFQPDAVQLRYGYPKKVLASSIVIKILNRFMEIIELLNELKGLWGIPAPEMKLSWDSRRKIFLGRRSSPTLYALNGGRLNDLARSTKSRIRSLSSFGRTDKQKSGNSVLTGEIPEDAILIPSMNPSAGFVVASNKAGLVIKVGMTDKRLRGLDRELGAWEIAKKAKISDHLATIYACGQTGIGARWLLSELVPNTRPFLTGGRSWRCHMKGSLYPALQSFYEASGIDIVDASMELELPNCHEHHGPIFGSLEQLRNLVERSRSVHGVVVQEIVFAQIHGDLFPKHIHRSNDNWKLIDFGRSVRKAILYEHFHSFLDYPQARNSSRQAKYFWDWLSNGDERILPTRLKKYFSIFIDWYSEWRGCPFNAANLRFQILFILYNRLARAAKSEQMQGLLASATIEKLLRRSDLNYSTRHFFSTMKCLKRF